MKVLIVSNEATPSSNGLIPDSRSFGLPESLEDIPNLSGRIEDLGCDVQIVHHSLISKEFRTDADRIILSGAFLPAALSVEQLKASYSGLLEFIRISDKPILGICMGMQLICMAFDDAFSLVVLPVPEQGFTGVHINGSSPFQSLANKSVSVFEKHRCMIERIPEGFLCWAHSETCRHQAIRHRALPIIGTQFHPEIIKDQHEAGLELMKNFLFS